MVCYAIAVSVPHLRNLDNKIPQDSNPAWNWICRLCDLIIHNNETVDWTHVYCDRAVIIVAANRRVIVESRPDVTNKRQCCVRGVNQSKGYRLNRSSRTAEISIDGHLVPTSCGRIRWDAGIDVANLRRKSVDHNRIRRARLEKLYADRYRGRSPIRWVKNYPHIIDVASKTTCRSIKEWCRDTSQRKEASVGRRNRQSNIDVCIDGKRLFQRPRHIPGKVNRLVGEGVAFLGIQNSVVVVVQVEGVIDTVSIFVKENMVPVRCGKCECFDLSDGFFQIPVATFGCGASQVIGCGDVSAGYRGD